MTEIAPIPTSGNQESDKSDNSSVKAETVGTEDIQDRSRKDNNSEIVTPVIVQEIDTAPEDGEMVGS